MRLAVAATARGFEDIVRALPDGRRARRAASASSRASSRAGPGTRATASGYDTIAAAGDARLHAALDPQRRRGARTASCVLVDAGVEVDSLYTADVTRTLPVDGTFTEAQRRVYQAVLDGRGRGVRRRRGRARRSATSTPRRWRSSPRGWPSGACCPVDASRRRCDPEGQHHRRWMVHGTSHHLGMDVHDCALARREMYLDGDARAGHGLHHRAGPVLQGGRPAGARGAARHRRADRGRRAGHRGRLREPLGGAAPPRPTRSRPGWRRCAADARPG